MKRRIMEKNKKRLKICEAAVILLFICLSFGTAKNIFASEIDNSNSRRKKFFWF